MREIVEQRRVSSKTFDIGNGRKKLSIRRSPYHYMMNGELQDIDLASRLDRGDMLIDKAPMALRIHPTTPMYRYTSQSGEVSVELKSLGRKLPINSTAILEGVKYRWFDVGKDTDYLITPLPFGVTTELVLKSDRAPKTWSWQILGDKGLLRSIQGKDAVGNICEITTELVGDVLTATWTGRVTSARRLRHISEETFHTNVVYPVYIDPTVNEAITAGADDAISTNSDSGDYFYNAATVVGVGWVTANNGLYWGGLRFQTIPIPKGAKIISATLTLDVVAVVGTADVNLYADDVDDAPIFVDVTDRIRNITKTTASANFTVTATGSKTVDVQSVVDEIIQRPGWVSNNDLRFGIFNNAGSTVHNAFDWAALEHATRTESQLDIVYAIGHSQSGIIG